MTALSVPLQYPPRFAVTEAVELIDLTLADPAAVADYYRRNRQHLALSMPRRSDAFYTLAQWQGQAAAYRAGGPGLSELRLARRYLEIDGVWRDHVLTSYVRSAP